MSIVLLPLEGVMRHSFTKTVWLITGKSFREVRLISSRISTVVVSIPETKKIKRVSIESIKNASQMFEFYELMEKVCV